MRAQHGESTVGRFCSKFTFICWREKKKTVNDLNIVKGAVVDFYFDFEGAELKRLDGDGRGR